MTFAIRVLSLAFIFGIIFTWPLWLNERGFPLAPVQALPNLTPFISVLFISAILLLLGLLILFPENQKFLVVIFILAIVEALYDQNRWQPWFYQYLLMLFLLLFYKKGTEKKNGNEEIILNGFRLIVCGIYFWSGIQKFNPDFFDSTCYWLTEPLGKYFGSSFAHLTGSAVKIIPVVEIFIAFGLMIQRTRKIAVFMAIAMHVYIILLTTPLGWNYNYAILPWNLAMITFLLLLFRNSVNVSLKIVLNTIRTKYVLPVFILTWIMPAFSLFAKWDSYLSASLYSGNSDNAYIYISKKINDSLPPYLKEKVHVQKDTLYYLYVNEWAMETMHVPAYPETHVFQTGKKEVLKYAIDSNEVIMMVRRKSTWLMKSYYIYVK